MIRKRDVILFKNHLEHIIRRNKAFFIYIDDAVYKWFYFQDGIHF